MKQHEYRVLTVVPPYQNSKSGINHVQPEPAATARQLQEALTPLGAEGWELISVTPVLAGHYDSNEHLGYSTTAELVVVLRRRLSD